MILAQKWTGLKEILIILEMKKFFLIVKMGSDYPQCPHMFRRVWRHIIRWVCQPPYLSIKKIKQYNVQWVKIITAVHSLKIRLTFIPQYKYTVLH